VRARATTTHWRPLHTLLERTTAKRFRDIFADFEFDASLITWIATANNVEAIPSTLRSRFTEIVIQPPSADQAITQTIAIGAEVIDMEAPFWFERPDRRLSVGLAHLTPREMKKALSAALRVAIANGRNLLVRQDFPRGVFDENEGGEPTWLH